MDDPVRMHSKQMGQVPLLTREQEVEISKRIEGAENEVKKVIYGFGFAAKEHIALAEKLISEPPKERFDRSHSRQENRRPGGPPQSAAQTGQGSPGHRPDGG